MLIPYTSAVQLNNTLINASGIGLTINVTDNIWFDTLIVQNDSIYFENIRVSDLATEKLSYNITTSGTYNGSDLPYISSSSATSKTITSGLTDVINSSVILSTTNCIFDSITYQSNSYSPVSCSAGILNVNLLNVPNGDSVVSIDYTTTTESANDTSIGSLLTFVGLIGLFVFVFIGFIIFKMIKGGEADFESMSQLAIIIVVILVTVIIAILFLNGIRYMFA